MFLAIFGIDVLAGIELYGKLVVAPIQCADKLHLGYILEVMEEDSVLHGRALGLWTNPFAVMRVHMEFAIFLHWTAAKFAFASGILAITKDLSLCGNVFRQLHKNLL